MLGAGRRRRIPRSLREKAIFGGVIAAQSPYAKQ